MKEFCGGGCGGRKPCWIGKPMGEKLLFCWGVRLDGGPWRVLLASSLFSSSLFSLLLLLLLLLLSTTTGRSSCFICDNEDEDGDVEEDVFSTECGRMERIDDNVAWIGDDRDDCDDGDAAAPPDVGETDGVPNDKRAATDSSTDRGVAIGGTCDVASIGGARIDRSVDWSIGCCGSGNDGGRTDHVFFGK